MSEQKWLVDALLEARRMVILLWADGKATLNEITTCYIRGRPKIISECRTLRSMDLQQQRTIVQVPLVSAENKKLSLQFALALQN